MTGGCGKGKGSGRSNKGGGNGNNKNRKNKNNPDNNKAKKKTLADCIYSVGTESQTSDYEVITEHLINHIKKNYKWGGDIVHALISRMDYDFSRDVPTEGTVDPFITNSTLQAKAKESLKLVYEQEIKDTLTENLIISPKIKAYGF